MALSQCKMTLKIPLHHQHHLHLQRKTTLNNFHLRGKALGLFLPQELPMVPGPILDSTPTVNLPKLRKLRDDHQLR